MQINSERERLIAEEEAAVPKTSNLTRDNRKLQNFEDNLNTLKEEVLPGGEEEAQGSSRRSGIEKKSF